MPRRLKSAEVPSRKRPAIVERLRRRIECFRKRHNGVHVVHARSKETQSSRELKQPQGSRIFKSNILEHNNTGLQTSAKRKFPTSEGKRGLQNSDEGSVSQKYARFENDVHCKPPSFTTAEENDSLPSLPPNNVPYSTVNGHNGEFIKSEELSSNVSSCNTSACENLERTVPKASQQYRAADFASSTFPSRGQSGEKSRTPEFTGTLKQENGLLNPNNENSASIGSGMVDSRATSEMLSNRPTRRAIVERLRQRIDAFRRRHEGVQGG